MLGDPKTLDLLRQSDDQWGTNAPFNNIYKLQAVTSRADKCQAVIQWSVANLHDECRSGQHSPDKFSLKFLKLGIGGGRGHLDLPTLY